jgi:dynein heavy chain 1
MLLMHLWDADLMKKKKWIDETLTGARGEALLETFLVSSKEIWNIRELELANYKNKCKVVRGWEDLRLLIEEHTSNITSMRMSPYFK